MRAWYAKQEPGARMKRLAKNKAWREAHVEEMRGYKRAWKKRHPENGRAYMARRYHAVPELMRARSRAWWKKNKPWAYALKNAAERKRRAENPAPYRERERRAYHKGNKKAALRARRNRKRDALGSHTDAEFAAVCARQKNKCLHCKKRAVLTEDHIVPLAKGGSDYILNIQGLCRNCNCRKQATLLPHVEFSLFDKVAS